MGLPDKNSLFQKSLFPESNDILPPLPRRRSVTIQKVMQSERKDEELQKLPKASQMNVASTPTDICSNLIFNSTNVRQYNNDSSNNFSETNSSSCTSKPMEVPLLSQKHTNIKVSECKNVSDMDLCTTDVTSTNRSRQERIYSMGLPDRSYLFQETLFLESGVIPPPLPRRHSVTPVRPPIPKRSRNEQPIPVKNLCQTQSQSQVVNERSTLDIPSNRNSTRNWLDTTSNNADQITLRSTLDQVSWDLTRKIQKFSSIKVPTTITNNHSIKQYYGLKTNRSLRRGEREQRSPTNKRHNLQQQQQKQPSLNNKDDDDRAEIRIHQTHDKFAEMQAASKRLESKLPKFEQRYQEDSANRKENPIQSEITMEKLQKLPKATQTNLPPPLSVICSHPAPKSMNARQDSNVSSDSFSQTSSPGYTSKTMEAPLLPQKHVNGKVPGKVLGLIPEPENSSGSPITKSMSTPASLQTIVRFPNGSNMSLHHRIIRDMRRPSSHYVTRGRLRFRFAQVLVNAVVLMAIAGGLAAYFKSYPSTTIKVSNENKTVSANIGTTILSEPILSIAETKNPAPGICLPVIVTFCQYHKIPYNYTVFPNYMGNFGQRDAQHELELYDAVIDVRCYELAALFLCSIFVPKCGPKGGQAVRPCRNLCFETKRRCGFFLEVFGLTLPEYLECDMFPESPDPNICVGYEEVIDAEKRAAKPICLSGFLCDEKRCIPLDWRCDGHVDCEDHTDEIGCGDCSDGERAGLTAISSKDDNKRPELKNILTQSSLHCGERRCMSISHICDGVTDCPWAQDERNCLRLSERNGDIGRGRLEVYHAKEGKFMPACIAHWTSTTAKNICSLLGYETANSSNLLMSENNVTIVEPIVELSQQRQLTEKNQGNFLQEFKKCIDQKDYSTVDLICTGYECGRRLHVFGNSKARKRIVGGIESAPGDWPFLAALLGGPEQVFYCAGVLIADQWILTASHCVGNNSEVSGWTIQLGITRRHAHTYLGKKLKVKRVVPHPNYNLEIAHDNDVALFQLEHRVEFHEHLRPVCLPTANIDLAPGTVCTVIGWGKKEDTETSEYEPAVNEVTVPVLGREVCNSWLLHKELNVTDGMICAGYPEGGKDACQGDSGGPLLCQDKNDKDRWFVGGIVSWGIKCAHPRLPGVYAYVPKYVSWILKEIEEYSENDYG